MTRMAIRANHSRAFFMLHLLSEEEVCSFIKAA